MLNSLIKSLCIPVCTSFLVFGCGDSSRPTPLDRYTIPIPQGIGMVYDYTNVASSVGSMDEFVIYDIRNSHISLMKNGLATPIRRCDLKSEGINEIAFIDVDDQLFTYYVADFHSGKLCALDSNFNVQLRYTIPPLLDKHGIHYSILAPFFISNGYIYTTIGAEESVEVFVKKPCFARHLLGTESWDVISYQPKKMQHDWRYYYDYPSLAVIDRHSGKYALGFPIEDSIHFYLGTQRTQTISMPWRTNFMRLGVDSGALTVSEIFVGAPNIRTIKYDSYRGEVIAIRADGQPLRSSSGRLNDARSRPLTVSKYNLIRREWSKPVLFTEPNGNSHPGPIWHHNEVYIDTFPARAEFTAFSLKRISFTTSAR